MARCRVKPPDWTDLYGVQRMAEYFDPRKLGLSRNNADDRTAQHWAVATLAVANHPESDLCLAEKRDAAVTGR